MLFLEYSDSHNDDKIPDVRIESEQQNSSNQEQDCTSQEQDCASQEQDFISQEQDSKESVGNEQQYCGEDSISTNTTAPESTPVEIRLDSTEEHNLTFKPVGE